ncbi:hypothetical protein MMC27_000595 [Xylographa pallens]|nr:hypothetical protein [Xylographa pallens]
MASTVPPGFVDLHTAFMRPDTELNVMGVVIDYLPPAKSKGNDWMSTFTVVDNTTSYTGEKARYFRAQETDLPRFRSTGDVVMLRKVKIKDWSGMKIILSGRSSTWVVFHQASMPLSISEIQPILDLSKPVIVSEPNIPETRYAITLCNSQDRSSYSARIPQNVSIDTGTPNMSISAGSGPKLKFSLIKDVSIASYYDVVGQVVKLYPDDIKTELYITDYTSNGLLYNYEWGRSADDGAAREGDAYGYAPRATNKNWQGPFGKLTLSVTLWTPHSSWTQANVKEGDFVFLRNVHIKYSRDSKIEGVIHTDRQWPEKVDVSVLDSKENADDRVKDVLRRKRDYMKKFEHQSKEFVDEVRGQKRKKGDSTKPLSSAQLKKRRRQERKEAEQGKKSSKSAESNNDTTTKMTGKELNKNGASLLFLYQTQIWRRRYLICLPVACTHDSIPPRSLTSIISLEKTHAHITPNGTSCTLPFQNTCSRATVRVVDFFPHDLADFAVRHKTSEFDNLSDNDDDKSNNSDGSGSTSVSSVSDSDPDSTRKAEVKWEWRFCLLLEDANPSMEKTKDRIKVFVADDDAIFLLKMDAENLRTSPTTLPQLREKLFILWGDLEERKMRAGALRETNANDAVRKSGAEDAKEKGVMQCPLRTPPFQCCIKEYGVNVKGKWERRFRMFGATIS